MFDEFVTRYYEMDPERVTVVPDGYHLLEGMRVLIYPSHLREDIRNLKHPWTDDVRERVFISNRWAIVTHPYIRRSDSERKISFVGIYENGRMHQRVYGVEHAWYVEIASIDEEAYKELVDYRKTNEQELRKAEGFTDPLMWMKPEQPPY